MGIIHFGIHNMAEKMAAKIPLSFINFIYWGCGWDLAKWLERLAVNAQSHNSPGFDPSILGHIGIRGAADETVLNNYKKIKKTFFLSIGVIAGVYWG